MGRLLKDNKGQVSIELIVVMAVLLGAAMFLLSNLQTTVESATDSMTDKSNAVLDELNDWNPSG